MNNAPSIPSDTPLHIRKMQIEIVMSKSNEERLRQCFEMIDFTYSQTMNVVKRQIKTDDAELLKLAYIEASYKNDITPAYLEYIKSNLQK